MKASPAAPLLTLPQVAQMAGGDLCVREVPGAAAAREAWLRTGIDGVSIDTRTMKSGDLFVPLPGGHADGHAFLDEAFRRGAAAALCAARAYPALAGHEPGPLIVVEDVSEGLMRLGRRHRETWRGLMLCITGRAGKTTTKDLVAAALATAQPTLKTEGNLNNHWGVPMTLMRLRPEHRAAVVEIAMNHPGEIALLAALAVPGAALITNAGSAHLEGLGSLDFVLMLVPNEAAYIEAVKSAPELYQEALAQNIGLVCPSTLLPTLRTIDNQWKVERQNRNALQIAEEAGRLYDKFVGFE